ncbi:unnamed protein product [Caenorhabditis bovis]|uniref:Uncharacterized protein n=1 Tax=Caenorhabditis bovis TaxID=2654633 RepID=A0A8S1EFU9_9PELO|nr:unnamed protein product [Caenorhabditis bovis]
MNEQVAFFDFKLYLNSKTEIIDMFNNSHDIAIVTIFTMNSNRDFNIFEFIIVMLLLIIAGLINFVGAIAIKRAGDYERVPRRWFFWSLAVFFNSLCLFLSCLAVSSVLQLKLTFVVSLTSVCLSMLTLEFTFRINKKQLRSLESHDHKEAYTLSRKFQLQENVNSLKLIRGVAIIVGFFLVFVVLTECLPVLLNFSDGWIRRCNLIFDTCTHLYDDDNFAHNSVSSSEIHY